VSRHQIAVLLKKQQHTLLGSKKNVKVPRIINVPKIGGFLPIVPIFTALSALGSLASGSAIINNARMVKEDMEEKKRHRRKIESVAVGEGLYLKTYRKGYGCFLKHYSKGKGIKKQKTSFSATLDHYQISTI